MGDEQHIARLVRAKDARAFDLLYASHSDRLYRLALRLASGDRALADDVFQDAWVAAIQGLSSWEGRGGFFAWLAGVALNCFRRQRSWRWNEELDDAPDGAEPELASDARLDAEALLAGLPPGYRAVLVLNAEGFTHEEIGALLGIEPGTSKSQLSRARRAARRLVGEGRDD